MEKKRMRKKKVHTFYPFVEKEFFHIFRDRRTMLILLGIPVVLIVLFGFAISTEIKGINVAVVSPGPDETVRNLVRQLDENAYFQVVSQGNSYEEAFRSLRRQACDVILVFGDGFEKRLAGGGGEPAALCIAADAVDPNVASAEVMYLTSLIRSSLQEGMTGAAGPEGVLSHIRLLYNPQMKSAYNFVPGIMGWILLLICAMMTSITIVREKEVGTMEVLLVSPVRPIVIMLAKMTPYFVLSCVNLATILLLACFLLDVPVAGGLAGVVAVSLLYIVLSLAIGLLISCVSKNQVTAIIISGMLLMMPIIVFSGMLFPLESMPGILQGFAQIVPAKWYIQAVRRLMIEGVALRAVWPEVCVLAAMTVLAAGISYRLFKIRLE